MAGRKEKTLDRDCKLQDYKNSFPAQNTNIEEEKLCPCMCLFSIMLPILAFMTIFDFTFDNSFQNYMTEWLNLHIIFTILL